MKITLVKKILKDGSPCAKCGDVLNKLEESGHMDRIDEVLVADERDPDSPGIALARQYDVHRAPFFLVRGSGAGDLHGLSEVCAGGAGARD